MLLCEVMVQFSICRKQFMTRNLLYEPCSRIREKLLLCNAAAADRLLRYSSLCSGISATMSSQVQFDESIALKRCAPRRMGLQILCSKVLLATGGFC
jgi:hypothetical protein